MLILMFPVFIFGAAFSTQTIVGDRDYKIDTLRDVISQGRIPFFLEGISMHDFFKGSVSKEYDDIYKRSVSEGFGEAFPLGPVPVFEKSELMVTFLSDVGRKLAPFISLVSGFAKANQEHYFSAKPFHKSLQAMLYSYNTSELIRNRSAWLCLVQILILMFPVFIFSAAFRTQAIVGTADYKIDTLRDVISQGRIPFFLEGISMHDFFKGSVSKDYADNYERAVAEGLENPFPLGPIPMFERNELMITFVSGVGKKLAPLMTSISGFADSNRECYSAKPFHKSLQAILLSFNASKNIRKGFDTIASRDFQSGIVQKIEGDIYIDFILSFYPTTLFEFHKSEAPRKINDFTWKPLSFSGFYKIFYIYFLILILITLVALIEISIGFS